MTLAGRLCLPVAVLSAVLAGAADVPKLDAELFRAIRAGDVARVRTLLAEGADAGARDRHGATPLMHAAAYSTAACMKLLLDRGADPNAKNSFGATALMWGADDAAKVRLLLDKGADVKARSNAGRTALMAAAATAGALDAVKALLSAGADVKARDGLGRGAVAAASEAGDPAVLRALLDKGGDTAEKTPLGSPMIEGAFRGNLPVVEVLLAAGADVNFKSARRPPVQAGLQDLGEISALMAAASFGHAPIVKLLLAKGAQVNTADMRGMTPLLLAATAESQDVDTVRSLLHGGADVHVADRNGRTILQWARLWGDTPIVKLLREAGAEPAAATVAVAPAPAVREQLPDVRQAVEKSIALLQNSNVQFFAKSGCGSCHHQYITGSLLAVARRKGLRVDEKLAAQSLQEILSSHLPAREMYLQRSGLGGSPVTDSALLTSLADQGYPANETTDAIVLHIRGFQQEDGSWFTVQNRPPSVSTVTETARAIRSLAVYTPEGRRPEIADRIRRARAWLESCKPDTNEGLTMQLLGLRWSGVEPAQLREHARRLIAAQRDDGGWSQRPGFVSDAYATGQALYALHEAAGIAASDSAYRRGVEFLRRTQFEDGSWLVRSRSVKFQPYFESGFPHGHDQWISSAGTAWAAMALALTL